MTERTKNSEDRLRDLGVQMWNRIKMNKWDTDSWSTMLNELLLVKIEVARPYYEKFFKYYPTTGRVWKQYIKHELMSDSETKGDIVKELWNRCLPNCYNVELWVLYINYVDSLGSLSEDCFNVALEHVGEDIWCCEIYMKYLDYLMENNHDIENTRSKFHKALDTPMHNNDRIWDMYEKFENMYSSHSTKAIITERSKKFKEAKKKYEERKKVRSGLLSHMFSTPIRYNTRKLLEQKKLWKLVVECEKRNTQRLDIRKIKVRVEYAYKQCLSCMRHLSEMWFEYADYLVQEGDLEGAEVVFKNARESLPDDFVLHFAFIDFLETTCRKPKDAKAIYDELLNLPKFPPILFVHYLRFVERTAGIKETRRAFLQIKKTERLWNQKTFHVFVTLANLEYLQKSPKSVKMAKGVFDIGFKFYNNDPLFVMQYVKFLELIQDTAGLRGLYERVFEKEVDKWRFFELFNRYVQFEYEFGDATTVDLVEQKFFDYYPKLQYASPIRKVIRKFEFLDLKPCFDDEIQFIDGMDPTERSLEDKIYFKEESDEKGLVISPDVTEMIECSRTQLKRIVSNPEVDYGLVGDKDLSNITKVLPLLPTLSGEHLPDIDTVMKTLQEGPEPSLEQVEQFIGKKRKRDRDEDIDEMERSMKKRKV